MQQGYGRIVMTTSVGVFGLLENLSYATAKAGVIGLTRSLTTEGAAHGSKVNAIAPNAMTRMAGRSGDEPASSGPMPPDLIAPLVAFLARRTDPTAASTPCKRRTPIARSRRD